jgi:DNA-binding phage protein
MPVEPIAPRLRVALRGRPVAEIAKAAKVTERTVRRILSEAGKAKGLPDTDTLLRLSRACGVSFAWLAAGEGQP